MLLWILLSVLGGLLTVALAVWFGLYVYIRLKLIDPVVRIFQEKPLFIIPRGNPINDDGVEEVTFPTAGGLQLCGLYLRATTARRAGVILFGLEYGSTRWACVPYCDFLRRAGYDIFTFEPRSQGESPAQAGYEPLQWVTSFEVEDCLSAVAYLRTRPDADPRGVGFFGISKGGGAGLIAAAQEPSLRCFVTDGIFATHTTMVPYMRKWVRLYSDRFKIANLVPDWYYRMFANIALRRIERARGVRYPHLERALQKLNQRPLLMIHGGHDTYIKPEMAQELCRQAGPTAELWLVDGARHNQAIHVANGEYQTRVLAFFQQHLGTIPADSFRAVVTPSASLTAVSV